MTQPISNTIYYMPKNEGALFGTIVDEGTENAKQLEIPADAEEGHPGVYALGVTVTIIAVGLFIAANVVAFPFAGPISLLALGILAAVTYGIINNQLACRQCIEYFTIGHTTRHQRLLKTEDPTLNGIVSGIKDWWWLGAIGGTTMALMALATGLAVAPILPYLALACAVGIGLVCLYAHIKAKTKEENYLKPDCQEYLMEYFDNKIIAPLEEYHPVRLDQVPVDKRAAYLAVGDREIVGYINMPQLNALALISIVALAILL